MPDLGALVAATWVAFRCRRSCWWSCFAASSSLRRQLTTGSPLEPAAARDLWRFVARICAPASSTDRSRMSCAWPQADAQEHHGSGYGRLKPLGMTADTRCARSSIGRSQRVGILQVGRFKKVYLCRPCRWDATADELMDPAPGSNFPGRGLEGIWRVVEDPPGVRSRRSD